MTAPHAAQSQQQAALAPVIERNIQALLDQRRRDEARLSVQERVAQAVTRFAGSMAFVYLHLLLFASWVVVNIGWLPLRPFDPSFVVLGVFASVEAIFLSTFVLIAQNQMTRVETRRAELDLQISLLAEHEITRLITLVRAIAQKTGAEQPNDAELSELQKDVAPEQVLERLDDG